MQIKRLRLSGFKSFVDPADLRIEPGLTGVVGPNGCGKSNLLEALRWVMGENRPTAMRGTGMEDVIFAGTTRRPARGQAEVALSIDNRQRLAPAGFNDSDGLDISRRITREAGSAYRINGREVRARDVQMLFADASTGAQSPALVRQGQISELINARPKARRRVLEDAAGIGGLYQRRHEAELRLKAAETNLTRVEDVIGQLTGQMADAATTRPDPDPAPGQWSAWARSGDRVIGAASLAGDQDPVPQDASEARRLVTVQQKVLHPDGATTPLERITATVELKRTGETWKVASYQYRSVGE